MVIYKVTNLINNKIYIGLTTQTLSRRKTHHLNDAKHQRYNSYFHAAIREYGKENFKWEVIQTAKTKEQLLQYEVDEIFKHKSNDQNFGYNLTKGGECLTGKDNPFYGKHHSEETRANWSHIRKGKNTGSSNYFYDKHFTGESNHFYGKIHSEISRLKIGTANSRLFEITDLETNQVYVIQNLKEFARNNNLNPGGLKSAARSGYIYKHKYKIKKID